jgi:hypothetical protein
LAAAFGVGLLLRQIRHPDSRRYVAVPLAIAAVSSFTYLPYWLGLDAPMAAKITFTTSLQIIGSLAPIGLLISAVIVGARQRQ